MEELVQKSWKTVYSHIGEATPPLFISLMDTITFDPIESYRPMQWIYNSEAGLVVVKDVRTMNISEVIQAVLRASRPAVHAYRYIPQSGSCEPLAVAVVSGKRMVLNERSLPSLQMLYPKGLEGITLLKYAGKDFDPRIFFYQMTASEASYDDSVRVRARDTMEEDLDGIEAI